jgi:hypothetical protein
MTSHTLDGSRPAINLDLIADVPLVFPEAVTDHASAGWLLLPNRNMEIGGCKRLVCVLREINRSAVSTGAEPERIGRKASESRRHQQSLYRCDFHRNRARTTARTFVRGLFFRLRATAIAHRGLFALKRTREVKDPIVCITSRPAG